MADVNAVDLTAETLATLDGNENVVLFDTAEGKKATLKVIRDYFASLDELSVRKIPRCKDITSYFTDGTLWNRISGSGYPHAYYDIMPGDYINMGRAVTCPNINEGSYGETGSQYVTVASLGGLYGNGDSNAITHPHLVMVPGQGLGGTQHFGRHQMNASSTAVGGYAGSVMHTEVLGDVVSSGSVASDATINQQLYYIFGTHLKTTRELLSNAINTSGYNRFGNATGCASGWAWTDCQAVLMSEAEVYGTTVWSSSGSDTGTGHHQFELFQMSRQAINNRSSYYWLKDVASSSGFALSNTFGSAYYFGASGTDGYVRPRFILA